MNRRESFKYLTVGCSLPFVKPYPSFNHGRFSNIPYEYIPLKVTSADAVSPPSPQRVPFQWDYFGVDKTEASAVLKLNGKLNPKCKGLKLRLTTAADSREEKAVAVSIPGTDRELGILDCRYAPILQTTQLDIGTEHLAVVQEKGLQLKLVKGEEAIYFFGDAHAEDGSGVLLPHILQVNEKNKNPQAAYLDRLLSLGSLQPFDWMEGCVLDGLWQIHTQKNSPEALDTIKAHLKLFFDDQGNLIHEDPKGRIADNTITDIESTLPFAIVARLYPDHPVLKKVEKFWQERRNETGAIVDYSITAEGSYTIAYPMAVLANTWNRSDLAKMALQQLRIREKLVYEGNNYLRYYPNDNNRTYKNWARGLSWYMLGMVRTMGLLKDRENIDDLIEELNRVAGFVLSYQKESGLWNCFLDNQNTIADTSGSAGISAAIAAGIHEGFLPHTLKKNTEKTWQGLFPYLTPDGLLSGVAQSNRGGEALQHSDYRVISQMGMGLMGQLYAYL